MFPLRGRDNAPTEAALLNAECLNRSCGNLGRVAQAGLSYLDYLLGDHFCYWVVAVLQANRPQRLLIGLRQVPDIFGSHRCVLKQPTKWAWRKLPVVQSAIGLSATDITDPNLGR